MGILGYLILTCEMNAQCFVWDQNERSLRETGKNQVQKERGGISQGVICVGTKGTEPA